MRIPVLRAHLQNTVHIIGTGELGYFLPSTTKGLDDLVMHYTDHGLEAEYTITNPHIRVTKKHKLIIPLANVRSVEIDPSYKNID